MLDTERNQPMRVCVAASGFSARMFGMAKGVLTSPMPNSKGIACFGSATKVEPMVGAALRCSQATGLPEASRPPSSRSTETVW